jgi:hypothetical protein
MESDDDKLVMAIIKRIKPHLVDEQPRIQGRVMAELLSAWLVCYDPQPREKEMDIFITYVRELVQIKAQELA